MIGYFDSSAFVKLLLDESHSELVHLMWSDSESVVASPLAYAEVAAALAASRRTQRIRPTAYQHLSIEWDEAWMAVRSVDLTEEITAAAGRLAATHGLSGADAVHLASALAVGREHVVMTVFDRRLHHAAVAERLSTVPARL